jgi:hypothetical protein
MERTCSQCRRERAIGISNARCAATRSLLTGTRYPSHRILQVGQRHVSGPDTAPCAERPFPEQARRMEDRNQSSTCSAARSVDKCAGADCVDQVVLDPVFGVRFGVVAANVFNRDVPATPQLSHAKDQGRASEWVLRSRCVLRGAVRAKRPARSMSGRRLFFRLFFLCLGVCFVADLVLDVLAGLVLVGCLLHL